MEPKVKDLMTDQLYTVFEEDDLKTLEELMKWRKIRHVPVVSESQRLIGLVSQRDLLTVAISKLAHVLDEENDTLLESVKVGDIMGKKIKKVTPETPLKEAAQLMFEKKYGCLPVVVEEDQLVGIVTESDFVRSFYEWDVSFGQ